MNRIELIKSHAQLIESSLRVHLASGQRYALLDFPDHSNVGDSAIWLGEVNILKRVAARPPSYVSKHRRDFNEEKLRKAIPEGPIFLHGGGNFGDIWPSYQEFRLHILEVFADRTIIQLPQTIHFDQDELQTKTAKAIARHKNFHLLVRDKESQVKATSSLDCESLLLPDSAFGLGPISNEEAKISEYLLLLRTDKERHDQESALLRNLEHHQHCDWLKEDKRKLGWTVRKNQIASILSGNADEQSRRFRKYQCLASTRVQRGLHLLKSAKMIVTDRLHGHILSTLIGTPHIALDNYYGKIGNYMSEWTGGLEICSRAESLDEAIGELFQKNLE